MVIFSVYNKLGFGHKEVVYQRALAKKFDELGIKYAREPRLKINYEGEVLGIYNPEFWLRTRLLFKLNQREIF